jgi:hypothetical protein
LEKYRALRSERPALGESLRQPSQHHKISVECHALKPSNSKRCKAVVMLEPPELALDGGAATIEVAPAL